jgi:hypothetical protein
MMIEAKVVKLKNISDRDESKMWVQTGDVFSGVIRNWPKVGESFYLFSNRRDDYELRTTPVTEIINDREFKTLNSIYRITTKSDIRDEKIKTILE